MLITRADWLVLIFYFAIVAAIGVVASLRVRGTSEYFLGGRRFGKLVMMGQVFSTATHAEMPVSLIGAVYSIGASGIWYQWKNLFATPFFWILAPVVRRFRRTTTAEVMEDRYGPWMGGIYTLFAVGFLIINTAAMLKGAGKVINQAAGGTFGVNHIVLAMTATFIVYTPRAPRAFAFSVISSSCLRENAAAPGATKACTLPSMCRVSRAAEKCSVTSCSSMPKRRSGLSEP